MKSLKTQPVDIDVSVAHRRRRFICPAVLALGVLLLMLGVAGPAAASVQAYPEPQFTNSTSTNTWFFNYNRVQGTENIYFVCFTLRRNGVVIEPSNGTNGPGSQNCTNNLYANGASGETGGVQPDPPNLPLTPGATYEMCATDWRWNAVLYTFASSACQSTTVDNTKPAITSYVNGTDTYTRSLAIQMHIDYSDAIAVPFPANFGCLATGGGCSVDPASQYLAGCSVPNLALNAPGARNNSFDCSTTLGSGTPDGVVAFCARAADAAIPDNPASSNQARPASSANLSDPSCGSVVLDRTAPAVSIASSATTAKVGELVNFGAQSSDATSGTSGQYTWGFGDNTPNGAGANTAHTYTSAGTYQARLTTTDGAGNSGQATKTITVIPSAGGGGGGSGGGNPPTGGGSGGTGGTITAPPSSNSISKESGGGGTQVTKFAGLRVLAPKQYKLRKGRRTLSLALTSASAGRVQIALSRGKKVVARGAASFKRPGIFGFKLKLPAKMKAGVHKLKLSFKPKGSSKTSTKTLKVRFVTTKAKRSASGVTHTRIEAR